MRKEPEKYDDRLASLFNEMKESHIYKSVGSGLIGGINTEYGLIEIFNPWIKTLLSWSMFDGPTKRININSPHYRERYIEGYLRGQFYFNNTFRNDPLETKDTIVINILEAEKRVKKHFGRIDLILNDKVFDDQGYNAGIYADILLFKREKIAFFTEVQPVEHDLKKDKLTIRQIALKLVYEEAYVTRNSANDLIKEYGHKSGDSLYNHYTEYFNRNDRKAKPNPYSKRKLKNKIKLFESVIEVLSIEYKQKAIDELNILKNYYKTDYESN